MPSPPAQRRRVEKTARPAQTASPGQGRGGTAAAATAAIAAAGGVGIAAPAGLPPAAAGIALTGLTAKTLMTVFERFFGLQRDQNVSWVRRHFRDHTPESDVAEALAAETEMEAEFRRKAQERVKRAAAIIEALTGEPRRAALEALINQERRYATQRSEAMFTRAVATVERASLRRVSPRGYRWALGPPGNHTPGCLFLDRRVIPWSVADRFRLYPTLHPGCKCRQEPVADGLVPDEATALRELAPVLTGQIAERAREAEGLRQALLREGLLDEAAAEDVARRYLEEGSEC